MHSATVIGAGIAGLAAGVGLARVGWDVTVVEAAEGLRAEGTGLTLWPNAMTALDGIGIGDAVRDIGEPIHRAVVRRPDGRALTELPLAALTSRYGPLIAVHRAELHRTLADAFEGELRFGAAATVVDRQLLIDGEPPRSALTIGADGIDSTVRTAMVGVIRPRPVGQFAARGVAAVGTAVSSEWWGRGIRFGLVPLRSGRTYWFAATGTQRAAEQLQQTFAGWPREVTDVLAAAQLETTPVLPLADLPPLPRWHDGGSTVLVGDAAHAMTPNLGQGAAQALADVHALVTELAAAPIPQALAAYQARRKRTAEWVVTRSRAVGRLAQARHRGTVLVRNGLAALTPPRLTMRQFALLLDHDG